MIDCYFKCGVLKLKWMLKSTFALIFIVFSNVSSIQAFDLTYFASFQKIQVIDYRNGINDLIDQLIKSLNFSSEEKEILENVESKNNFLDSSKTKGELNNHQTKLDMSFNFEGVGAKIRVLDKIYGTTSDFGIYNTKSEDYADLGIEVIECRYSDRTIVNYSGAFVRIINNKNKKLLASGWLINPYSSLFNIDNQRYDVVLLSCIK